MWAGKQAGSSATGEYGVVISYLLCTDSHQLWREMKSAFWVLEHGCLYEAAGSCSCSQTMCLQDQPAIRGRGEEVHHTEAFPSTILLVTLRHLLFAPGWEKIEGAKRNCCLGLERICSFKTARQTKMCLGRCDLLLHTQLYTCIWDANYSCKACYFPSLSQHCT